MTTLRNVRDLLAEALHETFLLLDFLLRKADERWVLGKDEPQ